MNEYWIIKELSNYYGTIIELHILYYLLIFDELFRVIFNWTKSKICCSNKCCLKIILCWFKFNEVVAKKKKKKKKCRCGAGRLNEIKRFKKIVFVLNYLLLD